MKRNRKEQILSILAENLRGILERETPDMETLEEIRLREEQPLGIRQGGRERLLEHRVTGAELRETLEYISGYSLYAYENEMRQGFLTVEGGHRVGIAGKIIPQDGAVKNFQYISSVNIRISHEIPGCADRLFPAVLEEGKLCHTLIISPPGRGKTTLLRDMVRQISDGNRWVQGQNVGVVDERSEIGGCFQGVPQNRLGSRTDILDNCPKAEGMMMLIRAMAPRVVAVDEVGTKQDLEALGYAMHCGATLLATVHGTSLEEIRAKPLFSFLVKGQEFGRYIVLDARGATGKIEGIYDRQGEPVCI
ncbi:stage III sporulation protein AA [Candidatus Bariatricus faecipullorum]